MTSNSRTMLALAAFEIEATRLRERIALAETQSPKPPSLVTKLRAQLKGLYTTRTKLSYSASCLSPITRIPSEIICTIFEAVVTDWERENECAWEPDWAELRGFLGGVLAVSRGWRETALHCPLLWRNVRCVVASPGSPIYEDPLPNYFSLQTNLERSGVVSLHIWFKGRTDIEHLFNCLIAKDALHRVTRFQSSSHAHPFHLILGGPGGFEHCVRQAVVQFESVETIALEGVQATIQCFENFMERNSTVQVLRLRDVYLNNRPNILSAAPPNSVIHHIQEPTGGLVVLPHLRELNIGQWRQWGSTLFTLSCIRAPRLTYLALDLGGLALHGRSKSTPQFAPNSFPSLHVLVIQGEQIGDLELPIFLSYVSSLKVLKLKLCDDSYCADLLPLLTQTLHGGGVLLPRLEQLYLDGVYGTFPEIHQFVTRRSHRLQAGALRTVCLSNEAASSFSEADLRTLCKAVEVAMWVPPKGLFDQPVSTNRKAQRFSINLSSLRNVTRP